MTLSIGDPIPDLELPATGDEGSLKLRDLVGQKLVIYFYPKDNTPGCTQEGQDFAAMEQEFAAAGARILGVSRDTLRKHENFRAKYGFGFTLLADTEEDACQAFDVIREKMMYGKKVRGIERSTFVFDAAGKLAGEWRKVKVNGHAAEVLELIRSL
ncbi:peroxiredoxin [Algiphilus aromaticivorans]|uniref:peroxiredoxin n=1 Tax=Algiphilus aromaticivorans TaxID=382454 RepID=UPI0005C25FD1|nr:peroxiredoxin [Algiphilus aromaticivorans]